MRRAARLLLLALVAGISGSALASNVADSLATCRKIADDGARLACYDGLVPAPSTATPSAAAVPTPSAPASPPVDAASHFGEETVPRAKGEVRADDASKELHAHIKGRFVEWAHNSIIELDNGQRWKVSGNDRGYYPNLPDSPEIVITEGTFGGYLLKILANGSSLRVTRIQ
jgi:hypothetical protein